MTWFVNVSQVSVILIDTYQKNNSNPYRFFLIGLLIGKVQCVYNSKLTVLEMNTIKSIGRANRNKGIRHGNTMR